MEQVRLRRERLARRLHDEDLDCFLLTNSVSVTYLTGFSGDSSYLVLGRDRAVLVSDPRFTEQIAEECPGLDTFIRTPAQRPHHAAAHTLDALGFRRVGFESAALSVAEFETLRGLLPATNWKPGDDRVETLRMVKDEGEVDAIRAAVRVAQRAFDAVCALLSPDDTELDISTAVEHAVRCQGARGTCFATIAAVGPRAALPHAPPPRRRVGDAPFLLLDWGVDNGPYKSDLTRVLDTSGRSSTDVRLPQVHAAVVAAQQAAIDAIRPGTRCKDVDAAARAAVLAAGFDDIPHGTGHGIGLQVHELPSLRPGSETILEPGMVMTVEPGIYIPGWGGVRVEDDVLVTPDGCERLSNLPREPRPVF